MRKRQAGRFLLAAGCAAVLAGCTQSNIVTPDVSQDGPDMNIYMNLTLDEDQLHEDVDDIYLDPDDYPMGAAIDFDLHLDEGYLDVTVVVKDDTSNEDAAQYASDVLKGINDQVAVQDYSYGESDEDTFGGLYQDNSVNLKIYRQSAYESGGDPIYETEIPKDQYMTFDIQNP